MASRFPQLLAMMAQSGIDAAATPNIAGGGMTDIFRGMSNAGHMAQQRDLATFDLASKKQRQIQDQLDYLRQMKVLEETIRHDQELEHQAQLTNQRLHENNLIQNETRKNVDARAELAAKNKPFVDHVGDTGISTVTPTDHLDFRFGAGMPGQGRLSQIASQPPSGTVDAVQSGMLSPEDEAARGGQFDLQFPMASPMEAASKLDTSSPEPDPSAPPPMSDLPFASPLSVGSNRSVQVKPTMVPKDDLSSVFDDLVNNRPHKPQYEIIHGNTYQDSIDGPVIAGLQKQTPEYAADLKRDSANLNAESTAMRALMDRAHAEGREPTQQEINDVKSQLHTASSTPSQTPFALAHAAKKRDLGRELTADEVIALDKSMPRAAGAAPSAVLSPEAVTLAAKWAISSGQMPATGNQTGIRAQILNRMAQIDPNAAMNLNKGLTRAASNTLVVTDRQLAQLRPFANLAVANLDRVVGAGRKIVDSGSPIVNMIWREAEQRLLGSPEQANFEAVRNAAFNEVSRILSSPTGAGVISQQSREEANSVISGDYTLAQLVGIADTLKAEMQDRMRFLEDEASAAKGRLGAIGGGGAPTVTPTSPTTPVALPGGITLDDINAEIERRKKGTVKK